VQLVAFRPAGDEVALFECVQAGHAAVTRAERLVIFQELYQLFQFGDDIVVSLPDTSYVVTYYRAAAFPQQLLTKSHSGREDHGAPTTQAELICRRRR
jgi:hypothetical protein